MTTPEESEGAPASDDVLAGEYVLGVLSLRDRMKVEERIERDVAFATTVARWQDDLAALNDSYTAVAPPSRVIAGIERRLFSDAPTGANTWLGQIWSSVLLWRLTSAALLVLLVGYGLSDRFMPAPRKAVSPLVAELSGDNAPVALFARYDSDTGRLQMTPVATDAPSQERSLELWLVPGGDAPTISLGVLPQAGDGAIEIPANLRDKLTEGATLAVSLEPMGGSPTGKATGPVIAVGKTRRP